MDKFKYLFIFFILILLLILNIYVNFIPLKKNLIRFESFFQDNCSDSNTVDSLRSCYQEVVKGKNNYINNLENKLKAKANDNSSSISTINKQITDINNTVNTIKQNVENSSKILTTTQNDILSKTNQTTEILKKAQEAKDKADIASAEYQ